MPPPVHRQDREPEQRPGRAAALTPCGGAATAAAVVRQLGARLDPDVVGDDDVERLGQLKPVAAPLDRMPMEQADV